MCFEYGFAIFLFQQNINIHLFVKHFHFSKFCNIFFYNQLAFVLHLLKDFYIVHNHILLFFFFRKILIPLTSLFWSLSLFFNNMIIFSWWIFRHFYIGKKLYRKLMLKCFKAFYCIITINFCIVYITHKMMTLESLHNHYYLLNYSLVQFVN